MGQQKDRTACGDHYRGWISGSTDRTFFKRNNRWVDANALKNESAKPDRVVEVGTPEFYKLVDQLLREGREGILALSGELLLVVDGKTVLIKAPPK